MEWKPDKISKSELERKQAEFAKRALDMAKRSETKTKKPNSDKEIEILPQTEQKPMPKHAPEKTMPVKPAPEKPTPVKPAPEKPKPESEKPIPEIEPYTVHETESPIVTGRVREAQIDAVLDFEATIYKKVPATAKEEETTAKVEAESTEDSSQCSDITDNPFGKEPEKKCEEKCTPPNFKEYIRKHNEQHCKCEKCKPPKKKWI